MHCRKSATLPMNIKEVEKKNYRKLVRLGDFFFIFLTTRFIFVLQHLFYFLANGEPQNSITETLRILGFKVKLTYIYILLYWKL